MGLETVLQVLYLDTNEKENLFMNLIHNCNGWWKNVFYLPQVLLSSPFLS